MTRRVPGLQVVGRGRTDAPKRVVETADARIKIEPNPVLRGTVYEPERRSLVPAAEEYFGLSIDVPVVERLPIAGLDELPALRWKLANIQRLRESPAKHAAAIEALRRLLDI